MSRETIGTITTISTGSGRAARPGYWAVCNWAAFYDETPRVGALLASADPIALDYTAARDILFPLTKEHGSGRAAWSDPDIGSVLRRYLLAAQTHLLEAGHQVRLGEENVALHLSSL
jgi:hypothetical protein